MKSVGPLTKSFSPEKTQIELACDVAAGLSVPGWPMLPGGPFTSPAKAAPCTCTCNSDCAHGSRERGGWGAERRCLSALAVAAAGITDHVWTFRGLIGLPDEAERS